MSDKIRIMHVTGWLDTGGVEEVLLITAKYNLNHKYELAFVTVLTKDGYASAEIEKLGYPVYWLNISTRVYDIRLVPKLIAIFKEYRPHVVHLYTKLSILGRIAAQMARIPIVICNEVDMDWKEYGIGLKFMAGIKKKLDVFTDKIIACSETVRQYWDKKNSHKFIIIHNPFDITTYPVSKYHSNRTSFKNGEYPIIGTVSRIHPVKGHEYLIKAMPKILTSMPSAQLQIVGTGPLMNTMKELAESIGIGNSVEFTGSLFAEDLYQAFSSMDIFVLPSLTEGFGIAAVEAMACGLPVAASAVGGISEIVKHGVTGCLFAPGDPESIADAVIEILSDYRKAREMGERGRQKVVREFSPEIYIQKLDSLYQELLESKGILQKN